MKRFLFDAICILMIVMLGRTYLVPKETEDFESKIVRFNQQIENEEIIEPMVSKQTLNPIEENWAGQLGQECSQIVIEFIDGSVRLVTAIFNGENGG